ncbi:MAG: hypothetical protein KTR14_00740 [Vampirovibrio sp.]|nr:hypothetical protein [Vampirovibrio sp.]
MDVSIIDRYLVMRQSDVFFSGSLGIHTFTERNMDQIATNSLIFGKRPDTNTQVTDKSWSKEPFAAAKKLPSKTVEAGNPCQGKWSGFLAKEGGKTTLMFVSGIGGGVVGAALGGPLVGVLAYYVVGAGVAGGLNVLDQKLLKGKIDFKELALESAFGAIPAKVLIFLSKATGLPLFKENVRDDLVDEMMKQEANLDDRTEFIKRNPSPEISATQILKEGSLLKRKEIAEKKQLSSIRTKLPITIGGDVTLDSQPPA